MAAAPELRQKIVERMRAGDKASSLAAEFHVNPKTVRGWYKAENAEPKGIPPPDAPKRDYKATAGRRPITEATAGMLLAGIFTVIAIFDGETWLLSPTERDGLASPFADSMRALPSPISGAINTYAAPVTFGTVFATIVQHKLRLRNERKKAPPKTTIMGQVPRVPPPDPGEGRTIPFVPPPPAANGRSVPAPGGPFTERAEPSLAEAIDAARSNLTGLDAREEAESYFA